MKKWVLPGTLLLILMVGCSNEHSNKSLNGPSEETLASLSSDAEKVDVDLPAFVSEYSAGVQVMYTLAYKNRDVLEYMPCFCGCVNQGHEDNKDCFIQNVKQNGSVVWDKMAAT